MRLTVTSFLTLDGVVQSNGKPEPELNDGFEQGGWQVPYLDEEFGALITDWMAAADAFLIGRKTYDLFSGHWPYVNDPEDVLASKLNQMPKYIVSKTLVNPEWNNSTVLKGDVLEDVSNLKRLPSNEVQVHGSGTLIGALMKHGLVDEFRLFIHPVILGSGNRLFEPGSTPTALKLIDTKSTGRGVAVHVYEPSGDPTYGAVAVGQGV